VRLSFRLSSLLAALGILLLVSPAIAQNPDMMDPEQNEAKAKLLLKQAIEGMGGSAFRNSVESECEGRVAQLDRNGSMMGFNNIRSYWRYPDKNRVEYEVKSTKGGYFAVLVGNLPVKGGTFIQLFSGDKGWTMDKSGVNEADAPVVAEFQNTVKRQIHNLLLTRASEEGVYLHYGGVGVVDLHPVEWLDITDVEERKVRLALDHTTHLPLRIIVTIPNEEMRDIDEDVTIYSNYKEMEGVWSPLQVTREHNGLRTHQIFYNSCNNNPNLPADFFTEAALQKKSKEGGAKAAPQK
jgi:hypothetical protein